MSVRSSDASLASGSELRRLEKVNRTIRALEVTVDGRTRALTIVAVPVPTRARLPMSWVLLHTSGLRSAWGTRRPKKLFGSATEVALPRSATPIPPPRNMTVPRPSRD